jgi:hypothetical protein
VLVQRALNEDGLLFIEEVLRGVERSLSQIGWSLLISFLRGVAPAGACQRLQKIPARVDGMLIAEGIVSSDPKVTMPERDHPQQNCRAP